MKAKKILLTVILGACILTSFSIYVLADTNKHSKNIKDVEKNESAEVTDNSQFSETTTNNENIENPKGYEDSKSNEATANKEIITSSLQNQINVSKNKDSVPGKWHKEDGQWYFVESGIKVKGWLKNNETWYFLNKEGAMQTDWLKYKDEWYYLNEDGAMQTGWVFVDNKYYYLKDNGAMAHDEYIDEYYVGSDGSLE